MGNDSTKSPGFSDDDRSHDDSPGEETFGEESAELAELIALDSERRRIAYRETELLAAVDQQQLTRVDHGHTTGAWYAEVTKRPSRHVSSTVRRSVRLHDRYQVLAEALCNGRVNEDHVRVFDRLANPRIWPALAELLPTIIDMAAITTFDQWERDVASLAQLLDQDGSYDPAEDPTNNHVRVTPLGDGFTRIHGGLVGDVALRIKTLLDAETDRVLKRYREDAEQAEDYSLVPSRAQAAAEALADLLERGSGVHEDGTAAPTPEMIVNYDLTTEQLSDQDNNRLSPSMLRWLIAAAMIRPLEVTEHGDALRMGHTLRYANREQRRALALRDGGCVFPGCTRPVSWCDSHHVDLWDTGGPTDIENMALLCRHHHRVTHQPGWTMTHRHSPEFAADMILFQWSTPKGRVIYSQRHHKQVQPTAA